MASIQRRTTRRGHVRYRAQVRLKNRPSLSATFRKRSDALNWAREMESAQVNHHYGLPRAAPRHRLSDAIKRYCGDVLPTKSRDARQRQYYQLKRWQDLLGNVFLDEVTPGSIARARDELIRESLAPATVVRYLAALSHLYTVASNEWEWLDHHPVRRVRRPKQPRGRVRFLTKDELSSLLRVCQRSDQPHLYPIVVLAVSTGMRKGEILGLRWQDIDLARYRITLDQTKNGERRSVPLVGLARAVISDHCKARRDDTALLFSSKSKPGVPVDFGKPWTRAVETVALEDFRFHDLRHTCASYLAMSGATLAEISEILGHKTLAMVKRYAHLSDSHTTKVVERMNGTLFNAVP